MVKAALTLKQTAMTYQMPHINLNGNSKESLQNEASETYLKIEDTIIEVAKFEGFNARNATDSEHAERLRQQRDKFIRQLKDMQGYFDRIMMQD